MTTTPNMPARTGWTRQQLLLAFGLYCQMPFGKMHSRNPEIVKNAESIGRTPSALAMKLANIASLDPAITSTGRKGLASVSAADRAMWQEMQADWDQFAVRIQKAQEDFGLVDNGTFGSDVATDYTGGNRTVQAMARVGQNFFRRAVLSAYGYKCCITGLAMPKLLVASHIVPWRIDEANRLNPRNGLCLSILHDKAFDLGIITVTDEMTVKVSERHKTNSDQFFRTALAAYDGKPIALPDKFRPHADFLSYHRTNVFEV